MFHGHFQLYFSLNYYSRQKKKQLQGFKGSPIIYNNCVSSCEVYPQSPSSSRKKKAKSWRIFGIKTIYPYLSFSSTNLAIYPFIQPFLVFFKEKNEQNIIVKHSASETIWLVKNWTRSYGYLVRTVIFKQVQHVLKLGIYEDSMPLLFKLYHHLVQQLQFPWRFQQLSVK